MHAVSENLSNAMVYVVRNHSSFGRTQLIKTIFFADLIHYNLCGTLMFPSPYLRMDHGPASCCALDVAATTDTPYFVVTPLSLSPNHTKYTYAAKIAEDLSSLPLWKLEMIAAAAELVRKKNTATAVSDLTHKFRLWSETDDNAEIDEELFKLNNEELDLLYQETGICLTPFSREFCTKLNTYQTIVEIEDILPVLSCSYPDDPKWDEWLDAYLAWESAVKFCCRTSPQKLDTLRSLGMDLIIRISCSITKPETIRQFAARYEQCFNEICEEESQKITMNLSPEEYESVNEVMRSMRQKLGLID